MCPGVLVPPSQVLLNLQRATINAQNHGLDLCISRQEVEMLGVMSVEVRDALSRYRMANTGEDAMQDIADALVGITGGGVGTDDWKRKRNEGELIADVLGAHKGVRGLSLSSTQRNGSLQKAR